MTFLRPEAWVLLSLAIPLALLHLYFRRRVVVSVPAVRIWQDLGGVGVGRRGFRWLRDGASLAILLLALAAFAGALADPVSGRAAPAPQGLVVVLDASVTMNTRAASPALPPGGPSTRFDAARQVAAEALDRLGPEDDVTVWLAKESPTVVVSPTTDHEAARAAIASLAPTLEESRLALTLDLARRAVALSGRAALLVVITDGPGAASLPQSTLEPDAVLVAVDQGASPSDASIERVEYVVDPASVLATVEVVVRHREGEPAPRRVVIEFHGSQVADVPVTPSATTPQRVSVPLPKGLDGVLRARLEPPDDFPQNDRSGVVVRRPRPLRVIVTAPDARPSRYLLEVLTLLDGLVDGTATLVTTPDAPERVLSVADVVVAEGALPEALPSATPLLAFSEVGGEAVSWPTLWGAGPAGEVHPVLRGVDLSPLRIDRGVVRAPGDAETRLVDSAAGALAFAAERQGDGAGERARRVLIGFRPDASTLPLEAAFPLLVRNALTWLRAGPELPGAVRAGDPLPDARAAAEWAEAAPRTAAGELLLPAAAAGEATVARVPRPRPGASRLLAVATPSGAGETYVRWDRSEASRLGVEGAAFGVASTGGLADLPDRRGARDTRRRWAPKLAALAALLLLLGVLLLPRRRRVRPAPLGAPPAPPRSDGRPEAQVGSLTVDGTLRLPTPVR